MSVVSMVVGVRARPKRTTSVASDSLCLLTFFRSCQGAVTSLSRHVRLRCGSPGGGSQVSSSPEGVYYSFTVRNQLFV